MGADLYAALWWVTWQSQARKARVLWVFNDARCRSDWSAEMIIITSLHLQFCDQGIVDCIIYIFTATLWGKYYLLLAAIVQVKTLRFVKVKEMAHGYTPNKQWNWVLDLDLQMLAPSLLNTMLGHFPNQGQDGPRGEEVWSLTKKVWSQPCQSSYGSKGNLPSMYLVASPSHVLVLLATLRLRSCDCPSVTSKHKGYTII